MQELERIEMLQNNLVREQPVEEPNEYYKLEIGQVFDRINAVEDFRLQLGIFFATANLTALGIALSIQKAGIVFAAAVIPIILIVLDTRIRRSLAIYYYRGLQLQKRFAPQDSETFLNLALGGMITRIREISELESSQERHRALTRIPWSVPSFQGFWVPLAAAILEIAAGLVIWIVFRWSLF